MILCIDDDPIRYNELSGCAIVTCRLEEILFYLKRYTFDGICLDYDMPFQNGLYFARHVFTEYKIPPVAIVSNNPTGADSIAIELDKLDIPNIKIPATPGSKWATSVMNWFKAMNR